MADEVKPDSIFQVATGFMAAKHLFMGTKLGLFEALAEGPTSLDKVAVRIKVPQRTLRIIVDALVVLGFITREGDNYQNTPVAQTFLSGRGQADLRPFLRFWNNISYPTWAQLETSIRTGQAITLGKTPTPEEDQIFSEGVEAINAGGSRALPGSYNFGAHQKLLFLGGWYISFLFPTLATYQHLSATVLMLPQWLPKAQERAAKDPAAARLHLLEGDYLFDPLPPEHDLVAIVNLAHHFSPENNCQLLRHVRSYVAPGTRLLFLDFWTNPTHTQPALAALMAAEFQTISGDGDVYSVQEASAWLVEAGWKVLEHAPVYNHLSMIVGEAV
jgi:hypothetical protein